MNSAKEFLISNARYNVWANKRIGEILNQLDESQLDKEIVSSFSSIRKTVFHIWDAEHIWMHRLKGVSLSFGFTTTLPIGTPLSDFSKQSELFLDFLLSQDDSFFTSSTAYKNIKGEAFTSLNTEIVLHCMNHSTFHRGQIVTMIRETGWKGALPSTDMIGYFRSLN